MITRPALAGIRVRTSGIITPPTSPTAPAADFGPDKAGWHTILTETFENGLANFNYIDNPNFGPQGDSADMRWRASQLSVVTVNGIRELQIATQRSGSVVNGGAVYYNKLAAAKRTTTTRIETKVAFDNSPNVKGVGMWWPTVDTTWPYNGELDMWEFGGGSRAGAGMNIHFGPQGSGGGTQDQYHTRNTIDFSQYHDVAWEWGTVAGQEYNMLEVDGVIECDSRGPNGVGKTYWQRGTIPTPITNARVTPMYPIFQSDLAPQYTAANVSTTPCVMHIRGFRIMEKV